jgi:hypothetical protein
MSELAGVWLLLFGAISGAWLVARAVVDLWRLRGRARHARRRRGLAFIRYVEIPDAHGRTRLVVRSERLLTPSEAEQVVQQWRNAA